MTTPRKVNRDDYEWCATCDGYVLKKYVREETDDDMFGDGGTRRLCPAGHELVAEPPAPSAA
jgi:hypothetical protein